MLRVRGELLTGLWWGYRKERSYWESLDVNGEKY
jgi:hypothetical protein